MLIKSKDNIKIKNVRLLENKKIRDKVEQYVLEGVKNTLEALENGVEIEYILVSNFFSNKEEYAEIEKRLYNKKLDVFCVEDNIFKDISTTITSQGIIAVAKQKKVDIMNEIGNANFIVLCDQIQDPGNLGTIIRICDAFGPIVLLLTKGCVDIYNAKTVRAAAGALFRAKIGEIGNVSDEIKYLKEKGFEIVSTVVDSKISFEVFENPKRICLVVGNEGNGVSKEIQELSDVLITIRMSGKTESLNASIAAGISIYEIHKKIRGE